MSDKRERCRISLDIPDIEHRRLKIMALSKGITLSSLLLSCIRDNLLPENERYVNDFKIYESQMEDYIGKSS